MNHDENDVVRRDLEALRRASLRRLPDPEKLTRVVRERCVRSPREDSFMKSFRLRAFRPLSLTALGLVAVAVVLLALPVTYERTVGYSVRLTLPPIPAAQAAGISSEAAGVLKASGSNWNASDAATVITLRLPFQSARVVDARSAAYCRSLSDRGLSARAEVVPVKQKVSGNVYAAAASELIEIRVSREGRSNAELEAEICDRLAGAGLPGADVQVTQEGDQTHIQMEWHAQPGDTLSGQREVHMEVNGN